MCSLIEDRWRPGLDGGTGRCYNNIQIERLWRTVKHEKVYLRDYETLRAARKNLRAFFAFYRNKRPHQALGYRTPAGVYSSSNGAGTAPASPVPAQSTKPETNQ